MSSFVRVVLESPFAGRSETERLRNQRYRQACVRDCVLRGESPYASHAILPGALDDDVQEERRLGIEAGFAWRECAAYTVVYTDLGVSGGMQHGIEHAISLGRPVHYRTIPEWVRLETCE